jgi:hypothetical protein
LGAKPPRHLIKESSVCFSHNPFDLLQGFNYRV